MRNDKKPHYKSGARKAREDGNEKKKPFKPGKRPGKFFKKSAGPSKAGEREAKEDGQRSFTPGKRPGKFFKKSAGPSKAGEREARADGHEKKRPFTPGNRPGKFFKKPANPDKAGERDAGEEGHEKKRPFTRGKRPGKFFKKPERKDNEGKPQRPRQSDSGLIRLNKFIANAGISSRREADDLITSGVITVNGKIITEMGYKVSPSDKITYGGQTIKKERMVYVLLNKPKDYITTLDDPEGRKTVLNLVRDACNERIYPVGRLDRNTTGLLLLTNDGELTKKLTHPKYGIKKLYHVSLDKPLGKEEMQKIKEGVELEDGLIKADQVNYISGMNDKREIGIEIHSGKNRVIRRLFESLDYRVIKLDRTAFAGLTKKDLPRGRWRLLTEQEIGFLKMSS